MGSGIPVDNTQLPPCLLYHKVTTEWEAGVTWVHPEQFKRQMNVLHSAGWKTLNPDAVFNNSTKYYPKHNKEFLLCFDDGYECIYTDAFPILEQYDFKALIFIPSGYIGKNNDWDHHLLGRHFKHLELNQIKELQKAGWTIGSHTVTHQSMTDVNSHDAKTELLESKHHLEDMFHVDVNWVSFPFGRYNRNALKIAREIGYKGAVVPVMRHNSAIDGFLLWGGDAVYIWDSSRMTRRRLSRGVGYGLGRRFRACVNWFSGGTLLWKRLFGI